MKHSKRSAGHLLRGFGVGVSGISSGISSGIAFMPLAIVLVSDFWELSDALPASSLRFHICLQSQSEISMVRKKIRGRIKIVPMKA